MDGGGAGPAVERSKLFQAYGVDFVIGSVHSPRGPTYDGSAEDTAELIAPAGGLEPFWAGYLDEVIEMVDASWEMITWWGTWTCPSCMPGAPSRCAASPPPRTTWRAGPHRLLEMVSDLNLALD